MRSTPARTRAPRCCGPVERRAHGAPPLAGSLAPLRAATAPAAKDEHPHAVGAPILRASPAGAAAAALSRAASSRPTACEASSTAVERVFAGLPREHRSTIQRDPRRRRKNVATDLELRPHAGVPRPPLVAGCALERASELQTKADLACGGQTPDRCELGAARPARGRARRRARRPCRDSRTQRAPTLRPSASARAIGPCPRPSKTTVAPPARE